MSDEPKDGAAPMSETELAAWREAYRRLQTAGSVDCPDDVTLAALATGETLGDDRERRERLADHVAGCRRCADRYRTLRDLHRAAGAEPVRGGGRSGGSGSPLRLLAAAAAVLGVVGLAWFAVLPRETGDPDALRGGPVVEEGVRPAPDARLAAPPRELAWPARDGALAYRVILYDAASSRLWASGSVSAPRLPLPDAVRSRLAAGESFFWVVEVNPGARGSRLGPFWFSLEQGGTP